MPMNAESLKLLIREELMRIQDARIIAHIQSMLIEPYAIMRRWDYGEVGQRYLCWMVLKDSATGAEIAYCEEGFGPKCPWGLVSSGERQSMGQDSAWFRTFMDAYFDSRACTTLPIWRVFRIESNGCEIPISAEGDLDSTWRMVMRLREDNPGRCYNCGHSISYDEAGASF